MGCTVACELIQAAGGRTVYLTEPTFLTVELAEILMEYSSNFVNPKGLIKFCLVLF